MARRNPLTSLNRSPTTEMKDYKELIDPQLWWLANGGDEQAMYELSERGPAHWLPARPNPEKGPEYWKLLKDSARIFARAGARPPKGYFANPDMEADLHAEIDKFARLNGRKRGMGSTVAFYHTRGGRSEVESDARMAWRAQAAAASDEADARLREEQAERDLRATLKQAGFTPLQITTAIRAHRARVAENKAKKNPIRARKNSMMQSVSPDFVPSMPGILVIWNSKNATFIPAWLFNETKGQMIYPGDRPGYWQGTKFIRAEYQSAATTLTDAVLQHTGNPQIRIIRSLGGVQEIDLNQLDKIARLGAHEAVHEADFKARWPDVKSYQIL